MELAEAMSLLTENHTAVAITVNKAGNPQSTVVTTGMVDGKLCWISRGRTIKVKNIERTGRATVTVLNLVTRRYVTVEGTAIISHWPEETDEIDDHVKLLKEVYIAMDRSPSQSDFEFSETMKEEKSILEDLIIAAHNNAKAQLKSKTTEEISKATGGLGIPGFKWPI